MTDTPRITFLGGGVQKAGTTALAAYLARHPSIRLPENKEAHVFDAPGFDDLWQAADTDQHYSRHFLAGDWSDPGDLMYGDATPIYVLHPTLVRRIHRYNAGMKWILLLRDPAERAYSHYSMEKMRDNEWLPPWLAFVLEAWRLRNHYSDFSASSPLRTHSYRWRGDYRRQLRALFEWFDPSQVLLLDSRELATSPQVALSRVTRFLGLDKPLDATDLRRFEGAQRPLSNRPVLRGLLSLMMKSQRKDYMTLMSIAENTHDVAHWARAGVALRDPSEATR